MIYAILTELLDLCTGQSRVEVAQDAGGAITLDGCNLK